MERKTWFVPNYRFFIFLVLKVSSATETHPGAVSKDPQEPRSKFKRTSLKINQVLSRTKWTLAFHIASSRTQCISESHCYIVLYCILQSNWKYYFKGLSCALNQKWGNRESTKHTIIISRSSLVCFTRSIMDHFILFSLNSLHFFPKKNSLELRIMYLPILTPKRLVDRGREVRCVRDNFICPIGRKFGDIINLLLTVSNELIFKLVKQICCPTLLKSISYHIGASNIQTCDSISPE